MAPAIEAFASEKTNAAKWKLAFALVKPICGLGSPENLRIEYGKIGKRGIPEFFQNPPA